MSEEDLYTLPLEEFTAARDKLAKEMRKSDKEAAARLAKLPKPTPAAWTANQIAREQPDLISALLDAGASLRAAQDAALAGGGADTLRQATQAERRAVDDVMRAAAQRKPGGKPLSRAMADRLRTTLHAAAGDSELRAALQAGRLVGEAQAGGAWPFALDSSAELPPPPPKRKPKAKDAAEPDPEALARAERERQALEDELREARANLKVRERVAKGAEQDATEAADALERARMAFESAQAAFKEAEEEAASAERVLKGSQKERDQARDTVARLEERLD